MKLIMSVPAFSILLPMFAAIICSALNRKKARIVTLCLILIEIFMSLALLIHLQGTGESYVYVMGQFPAPWGNELRAGVLEALMALLFTVITLFSVLGGTRELEEELHTNRENLFFVMTDLMLTANIALVYTNDVFTGYVFIEINTIAACGLIIARRNRASVVGGVRYMIMSLMGSGLVLMGICFMYNVTGHLLMEPVRNTVDQVMATGEYRIPLFFAIALITIGLGFKSALWPFHTWLPVSYAFSTPSASAMLSSVVSKGYIFFLIKLILRVFGLENYLATHINYVLLTFGVIAMIYGSVRAISMTGLRKMIAFSSVAQIGYIFAGIGLGTIAGIEGAIYHIFAHSSAKALAFIACSGFIHSSGSRRIRDHKGAAYLNPMSGVGFVAASLSMIGIPGFAGFASKLALAQAALEKPWTAIVVLVALAVSTVLNAIYFMRVVLVIYTPLTEHERQAGMTYDHKLNKPDCDIAIAGLVIINLLMGLFTSNMTEMIHKGLEIFM